MTPSATFDPVPTVDRMTDLNLSPALTQQLDHELAQCHTPTERAALLRALTWQIYTHVRSIPTGDGLDGHDSPERTTIGDIHAQTDRHFFDLAKAERSFDRPNDEHAL